MISTVNLQMVSSIFIMIYATLITRKDLPYLVKQSDLKNMLRKKNDLKDCVCYIFASLLFKSKREHL